MLLLGPSHKLQPAPLQPSFADFFDGEKLNEVWQSTGQWRITNGEAVAEGQNGQTANAVYNAGMAAFLAEVTMRALANSGGYGLDLLDDHQTLLHLNFMPAKNQAMIAWDNRDNWRAQFLTLPDDFNCYAYHLVRVTVDGRRLRLCLDDYKICWQGELAAAPTRIALSAERAQAAFAGFALTFRKENGYLTIHWEQHQIAALPVSTKPTCIGLYGCCATAAFDMVRVTAVADVAQS